MSGSEEDLRREFAELRQRFDDERADREEAEAARKADAESQSTQMSDMMRMMTALMSKNSGQEEERGRSAQVAPTTTDEEQEAPALSTPDEEQEAPASAASFQGRPERFFVPAEAATQRGQPGGGGRDWGYAPHGESTIQRYSTHMPKMQPLVLADRKQFKPFEQDVRIYAKYMDFESVLISDPPMDVGAAGNERSTMLRRRVSPT